jgi:hypothetical protein
VAWLGRFLDGIPAFALALLDAPVVIVSFFGIVTLISLGRVPDGVAPLFYGDLAALVLATIVAMLVLSHRLPPGHTIRYSLQGCRRYWLSPPRGLTV